MSKLKFTKKSTTTEAQETDADVESPKLAILRMAAEKAVEARGTTLNEEAELKIRLAEIDKIKKAANEALAAYAEELEQAGELKPDEKKLLETGTCVAEIGKRSKTRTITETGKEKLTEFLSEEDFFKLANFKLGDLDAYLTPVQQKQVIKTEDGDRSFTVKHKG